MNARIIEMAIEAGFNPVNCTGSNVLLFEKFAELIVQECINQVKEQYLPVMEDVAMMNDEHWKGYKHCGVDSVVAIKEHFGVEE
jgi:hypothetical protein